eukprot:7124101-Pyramimonas_sp.AAC.1
MQSDAVSTLNQAECRGTAAASRTNDTVRCSQMQSVPSIAKCRGTAAASRTDAFADALMH